MFTTALIALTLNASQLHLVVQDDVAAQVQSLRNERRSVAGPVVMLSLGGASLLAGAGVTGYMLLTGLGAAFASILFGVTGTFAEILPYLLVAVAGMTLLSGGIFVMVLGIRLLRESLEFNEALDAPAQVQPTMPAVSLSESERVLAPMATLARF